MNLAIEAPRRASSPYARRLARDRGIRLADLIGSGPGGRITGADIFAAPAQSVALRPSPANSVPAASHLAAEASSSAESRPACANPKLAPIQVSEAAPVAGLGTPVAQISAFTAKARLTELNKLLARFAASGQSFELVDLLVKAAALGLAGRQTAVALELEARQLCIDTPDKLTIGALCHHRLAAQDHETNDSLAPAALSLRLIETPGLRPIILPLLPGRRFRLVVSPKPERAHLLLVFDAALVSEAEAALLLGKVKAALETPLQLFV